MHEPLSQRLARILEAEGQTGPLTLNQLLLRTEGRGLYLVIIILSVPFVTPVPLPGVSTVVGAVIMLLGGRLALGLPPALPPFVGERQLPHQLQSAILTGSVKLLRSVERFAKPRRTQWLGWPAARAAHALLIMLLGMMLALPIPPIIPFSNALPGLALILVAVSMMEEDGFMIWFGYGASVIAVLWLVLSAGVIIKFFTKFLHWMLEWLRSVS